MHGWPVPGKGKARGTADVRVSPRLDFRSVRGRGFSTQSQVEEFHTEREGHGKVNLPFGDFKRQTFADEGCAYKDQER